MTPKPKSPWRSERREEFLEKPLPSSEEAERVVLGAVLLDNDVMAQLAESLEPEHFYSPLNKRIFAAMVTLFGKAKQIDPILIAEELKKEGSVESIGGVPAITNLTFGLPHFSNVEEYIKIIRKKWQVRELIRACNAITSHALSEEDDADDVLAAAEQKVFTVCENPDTTRPKRLSVLVDASLNRAAELMRTGVQVVGIPSGLKDLDEVTGGWRDGNLIILAGRPSMGKSAAAIQFGLNGASDGRVVAYFTLEDTEDAGADRIIAQQGRLNLKNYRAAKLTPTMMNDAESVRRMVEHKEFYLVDQPAITPMQVMAKCRRIHAEHKRLDLIVIDYLQLMGASETKRFEGRTQEVSQITRELKLIAREMNCPLIALSQLSREVEKRQDKRPIMSDLRESGSIEQDADVIVFVFREEYYEAKPENLGLGEFVIAKQKNGPTHPGVKVAFLKEYVRFENYYDGDASSPYLPS